MSIQNRKKTNKIIEHWLVPIQPDDTAHLDMEQEAHHSRESLHQPGDTIQQE